MDKFYASLKSIIRKENTMRREDVLETYYLVKEAGRIPLSARGGRAAILSASGHRYITPAVGEPLVGKASALKNKALQKNLLKTDLLKKNFRNKDLLKKNFRNKKIRARGGKPGLGMYR